MALNLRAAVDQQLQLLKAEGYPCTADPRNLNPPCLLLLPPAVTFRFGKCWDADWRAYLVATDAGPLHSLDQLSDLLEGARVILDGVTGGEPADVTLPDGAGTVPGYVITWSTKLPL